MSLPLRIADRAGREALGIPFVELYGMSETAGLISSNLFAGERRAGSAGVLTPDHEVRFAPDGELLVKGPLLLGGSCSARANPSSRPPSSSPRRRPPG